MKEGAVVVKDHSRKRSTFSLLFKASYSFTDRFFAEGLFSWVQQVRKIGQTSGFEDWDRTRGFGDAVILINYNYLALGRLKFTAGLGPKLPTGASDLRDDRGLTLNADLQPGSGAWDGVFLHRFQATDKLRPSRSYVVNFTYRLTGINSNYLGTARYRFGNEKQVLAGVVDQFLIGSTLISFGLNARYRSAAMDTFNGEILPNTGGAWLFAVPLVGWHLSSDAVLSVIGEFPLYADVDGTQLSPTFRINGGIYYAFSKK